MKSACCNIKNTFVQDILQRHSNKKADFRVKVILLAQCGKPHKEGEKESPPFRELGGFR